MDLDLAKLRSTQLAKMEAEDRKELMRQLVNFDSLSVNGKVPTDIDAILDYRNRCWVIIEYKFNGAPLPEGQQICLQNLVDALENGGKPAIAIVADHEESDPRTDIAAGGAIVRATYWNHRWNTPKGRLTAREMAEKFCNWVEG